MIIWMDDALFSGEYPYVDNIAILRNAANRRHTLIISDDPLKSPFSRDFVRPCFDTWLDRLPDFMQVEINRLLDKLKLGSSGDSTSFGLAKRLLITERDADIKAKVNIEKSCFVSFDSAARAVSLPLHILVENQINDAAFIRRVMPPKWRIRLNDLECSGRLRYVQGGGIGEIKKMIEFHCVDGQALKAFGLSTDVWKLLHFVLYDRDIYKENNTIDKNRPSTQSEELRILCENQGMKYRSHQLERRAQENYLPYEILEYIRDNENFKNRQDKEEFFTKLNSYKECITIEKNFFDMITITTGNLGKRFFKSIFAKENLEEVWQDEWFDNDGSRNEMVKLAESIIAAM